MKQAIRGLLGLLAVAGAAVPCVAQTQAPVPLAARLAGNTLSAVAYVPWRPGLPGGGELARLMLQAYLRADGWAEVRVWDPAHDSYTVPVERHWTLDADRLCIDLPTGLLCAAVHVWGPRIAGVGTKPYAMLDGDLQPGNTISHGR
ncbi:MAG TPA: hypothetical protein VND87_06130 [Stellaceae bacterium]|nr:hypothetical protein [Stellaceae bacterium]